MIFANFPQLQRAALGCTVMLLTATGVASAQTTASSSALSDRFQIDVGYFKIDASTVLRYDAPAGSLGEVDFEEDLGLADDAATLWLDATWRLGRRHQVKLTYTSLERDRTSVTLERSFTWGGQVYNAGFDATATSGTDILGGYYRFAVYRNERFEVGPTLGIGYLWLNAGIRGTAAVGGPGGGQGTTIDESSSIKSPTGAVGGYTNIWLARRLVVRGDYLYINVTADESEASVTDWRIGADYYFLPHVGAGVQYKHYTYGYDRGAFEGELGGEIRFAGIQAFVSFLF